MFALTGTDGLSLLAILAGYIVVVFVAFSPKRPRR